MTIPTYSVFLADEDATVTAGSLLGGLLQGRGLITLQGNLGGGKTTFSRGLIRSMGHQGAVKSPTYTLVEPYEFAGKRVLHYDLYRLADPEELEYLGMRDFLDDDTLTLVEWPERAAGLLPDADLALVLEVVKRGRTLRWTPATPRGDTLAEQYRQALQQSGLDTNLE